ncbi:hypothetical protein [Streptomyces sp. NPDC051162]|uniref:hypothetical protein n=1 Tax=Streptomyces sp. NPDC051162 TaxID=3154747 RepID=UPI00343ABFF8
MTIVSERYPAPGPMALSCSQPGCRPDAVPLPSASAARTAAAGHLAAHGHETDPGTACGCGDAPAHHVITHTRGGRTWHLLELCAACTGSIPDARVLRPLNARSHRRALNATRAKTAPSAG